MESFAWIAALAAGAAAGFYASRQMSRLRQSMLEERLSETALEAENLRSSLTERDAAIAELREDAARLKAVMESEKAAAGEKLEILNKTAAEMCETFKALSSDALRDNSQSFLDLAKSTLEKYQAEAKGDLEVKQKEVASLVAPIKESLEKVDAQLQEVERSGVRHTAASRSRLNRSS